MPGFKKFVRTGLVVEVAGTVRVDAKLEVGAATESVTVNAEVAPQLKTEGGEVSHNIATSTLDDLPILTLTGGAAGIGTANTLGNIRNPLVRRSILLPGARITTDSVLRINGMPSNSQSINVEGQDATNGFFKQQNQINQAGVEAIQEVAIQTSNFAAEYGQAGGGYFNYTMKSGTNQLHGSAYDYFVNEVLNAGSPFTDAGTNNPNKAGQHVRNPLRQNDYGFTLGGPVRIPKIYNGHDKTFFFFNFEQFRQSPRSPAIRVGIVPTAAQRSGDFSAALRLPRATPDPAGTEYLPQRDLQPSEHDNRERHPGADSFPQQHHSDEHDGSRRADHSKHDSAGQFARPLELHWRRVTQISGTPRFLRSRSITTSSQKMKVSGYYSATKTLLAADQRIPATVYRPAASERFGANDPHQLRLHDHAHSAAAYRRGLSAHFQSSDRARFRPEDTVSQHGRFPSPPRTYFPYLAGMYSATGGGWSGGGPFPVGNTGVAFTLTPEAQRLQADFQHQLNLRQGQPYLQTRRDGAV